MDKNLNIFTKFVKSEDGMLVNSLPKPLNSQLSFLNLLIYMPSVNGMFIVKKNQVFKI